MKGYKTAYTPSEVRALEKKARREGGRMVAEAVYACACMAMLDHGIDAKTVTEIAATANSAMEYIVLEHGTVKEITNSIRETYGLELNFYGSDTTVFGERGKIK